MPDTVTVHPATAATARIYGDAICVLLTASAAQDCPLGSITIDVPYGTETPVITAYTAKAATTRGAAVRMLRQAGAQGVNAARSRHTSGALITGCLTVGDAAINVRIYTRNPFDDVAAS